MSKHKDIFDENDENKLEYTTIFEEYVKILERTIDTQLYQNYQEAQISAFYNDFKDNFKEYQKVNSDTVEILFGFIDFNKFKTQMLEVKKSQVSDTVDVSNSDDHYYIDEATFWEYIKNHGAKGEGFQKKIDHTTSDGNVSV